MQNAVLEFLLAVAWSMAATREWVKLKQLGDIPRSRNGHSLTAVQLKIAVDAAPTEFLVLFGGAGHESGPLSDSFIAVLPDSDGEHTDSKSGQSEVRSSHKPLAFSADVFLCVCVWALGSRIF